MPQEFIEANGVKCYWLQANGVHIHDLYSDGEYIYSDTLYIDMAAPLGPSTINLRNLVDANNPLGRSHKLIITNSHTQPRIDTGNLSNFAEVYFINNGSIQANSSSGTAFNIDTPIYLENNGTIYGAGGQGKVGVKGNDGNDSLGAWEGRVQYDDPRYWDGDYEADGVTRIPVPGYQSGKVGFSWDGTAVGGNHNYTNRFWKSSGAQSGAWCHSGGPTGQEYWDVNNHSSGHAPIWGDQGYCHYNTSGYWCRITGGFSIAVYATRIITGGAGGAGGLGQFYGSSAGNGSNGNPGVVTSGPTNGFDSNGNNYPAPDLNGYYGGTDGYDGGTWGQQGLGGGSGPGYSIDGTASVIGSITGTGSTLGPTRA